MQYTVSGSADVTHREGENPACYENSKDKAKRQGQTPQNPSPEV